MAEITDDYMRQMHSRTKAYCLVLLRPGPNIGMKDSDKIIWEHGRRNHALRAEGTMPIVCPVPGRGDLNGIGIFVTNLEETKKIMNEDPAVKAGVFRFDAYECRSFPGDRLP